MFKVNKKYQYDVIDVVLVFLLLIIMVQKFAAIWFVGQSAIKLNWPVDLPDAVNKIQ